MPPVEQSEPIGRADVRPRLPRSDPEHVGPQLGQDLPDWLNVKAVEETADTVYVVVPHVPQEGEELDDADLEKVFLNLTTGE